MLKSFNYSGLEDVIAPFFFEYNPDKFTYANIKLEGKDALGSLTDMEKLWKKIGGQGKFTATESYKYLLKGRKQIQLQEYLCYPPRKYY